MKKVADILKRKGNTAVSVSPDTRVIEALRLMEEKNIGSVVITKNGSYHGLVTERDYSRKVVLKGKHSDTTLVDEIMSTDLPPVFLNDSIEHCMQLMSDKNIRYLPVFENDTLVGIISISDVVKETILAQQDTINHLEKYIHSGL
jgi:CBS domain-containing protein